MYVSSTDEYQDIRDAVRALCAEFPDAYHREIDAARAKDEPTVPTVLSRELETASQSAGPSSSRHPRTTKASVWSRSGASTRAW